MEDLNKILLRVGYGIGMLAILFGCSRDHARESIIKVSGSSTVLPIVTRAAEKFMQIHSTVKVTVGPGGSGVGVVSVAKVTFIIHVIGRDAVAGVLSAEIYEAGVKALSKDEIRRIYSGEIMNWNELGGPDREILCIDKESSRGTRHVFMDYIFGDPKAKAQGTDLVSGSNNEEQTKIAQNDAAIGMLSVAWMNDDVKGIGIKIDGLIIEPTLENIKTGSYPISRNLALTTNGDPTGLVKQFIDFIQSPEGQKIVEESGYVPIER
jgi:phosphate transport system substrate-binding protein